MAMVENAQRDETRDARDRSRVSLLLARDDDDAQISKQERATTRDD
jgi:hypothetical protein